MFVLLSLQLNIIMTRKLPRRNVTILNCKRDEMETQETGMAIHVMPSKHLAQRCLKQQTIQRWKRRYMSIILFTLEYLIRHRRERYDFNAIIRQECLGERKQEHKNVDELPSYADWKLSDPGKERIRSRINWKIRFQAIVAHVEIKLSWSILATGKKTQ